MSRVRMIGCLAAILAAAFVSTGLCAEPVQTELDFAAGLRRFQYFDLAALQYQRLDWRKQQDAALRMAVAEGLIDTYMAAAAAAYRPSQALPFLHLAAKEIEAFAGAKLSEADANRINMKLGDTLLEIGQTAHRVLQRKPQGVDLAAVTMEGEQAYDRAVKVFADLAKSHAAIVARVRAKPNVNDDDRLLYHDNYNLQIVAEVQGAWVRYRRALLYKEQKKVPAAEADLKAAIGAFETLSKAHAKIVAGLSATLGWALCLQEMGNHKEAIATFNKVLESRSTEETLPIVFTALYEKARSQSELKDYDGARDSLELINRRFTGLPRDMREAVQLRYAGIIGRQADGIREEAEKRLKAADELKGKNDPDSREKSIRLRNEAQELKKRYQAVYARAIEEARELTKSDSAYAQEATILLGQWTAAGDIKQERGATDYYADGESQFEKGDWTGAAASYREAIRRSRKGATEERLIHNSWIQMGKAYANLKRHYEAGLVLGRVVELYPQSEYAESAAVYSSMLLGATYKENPGELTAQMYLEAQETLVDKFPQTDAAKRAAFRLGDVRRAQRDYERAAGFYAKVDKASPFYDQANYLAGQCLWDAAKAARERGDTDAADALVDGAKKRIQTYVTWADAQPLATPEVTQARFEWTSKSRALMAEMLLDEKRYKDVLEVVSDQVIERFRQLPANMADVIANSRLYRLRAHCFMETPDSVRKAGGEMDAIRNDQTLKAEVRSTAARFVGVTFLKIADAIAGKMGSKPAQAGGEVPSLLNDAKRFLLLSLELSADQSLEAYSEIAGALSQVGAHKEAAATFELLIKRFQDKPEHKAAVRDARRWVGVAHLDAGNFASAAQAFEKLKDEYPTWIEVRRDLARCYESDAMKRFADAEKQWRVIEETLTAGTPEWFEAKHHRISNLLSANREDLAYGMLAALAVPYPELGGDAWKPRFLELVEKRFGKERARQFAELQKQIAAPAE